MFCFYQLFCRTHLISLFHWSTFYFYYLLAAHYVHQVHSSFLYRHKLRHTSSTYYSYTMSTVARTAHASYSTSTPGLCNGRLKTVLSVLLLIHLHRSNDLCNATAVTLGAMETADLLDGWISSSIFCASLRILYLSVLTSPLFISLVNVFHL